MSGSIRWFIDRPVVTNLLMIMLLLAGWLAMQKVRQETLPNVPLDRLGVVVVMAQATPERVERLVCTPLENALYGIEGLTELISEAREGQCTVRVDVEHGYDSRQLLERVRAELEALDSLPAQASRPQVQELVVRNRVARLVLAGDIAPLALYRLAQDIRSDLLAEDSISVVDLESLPDREVALEVPREELYRYRMTLREMAAALAGGTDTVSGGVLRSEQGNLMLETGRRPRDSIDYLDLQLRGRGFGDSLYVRDIAQLHDGFARDAMAAWHNGRPAVALDVYRVGRQQVLDVSDTVQQYLANRSLPPEVSLQLWQDDAAEFRERTRLLWWNGLQALLILGVLLGLALGVGLARWVVLGIPVAMIGACVLLPVLNESINTISLFAFLLVLGIVVDDAIIVGESIHHQRRLGYQGREAALRGARAVARPVCYAVLTTVIAFMPMLFLPGPEGALMRVIPIVAIGILLLSLVECLWILPTHMASEPNRPPRWARASEKLSETINRHVDAVVARFYRPTLLRLLRWRYPVIVAFLAVLAVSLALVHTGWVRTVLFSQVEADHVLAEVTFPQGTPVTRSRAELRALEASAAQLEAELAAEGHPDIFVQRLAEQGFRDKVSTAADPDAGNRLRYSIRLASHSGLSASHVAARWRQIHGDIPGALEMRFDANLLQTAPDIHLNLYHPDLQLLDEMAEQLHAELRHLAGVHEITNSMHARRGMIDIELTDAARHAGLSSEELGRQVREAFHGIEVDRLAEGDTDVPVVLRLANIDSRSQWDLQQLPVTLPGGEQAPLAVMASLTVRDAPAVVSHYERRRNATLTALIDNRLTSYGQVMASLEEGILQDLKNHYPGADWGIAGKPKAIELFLDHLHFSYLLAMLAIFFLLTVLFGNWMRPLLVMSVIPFGMVGAIFGHFLFGFEITLWSIIGVIAVSGVVVNDNLVLLNEIGRLQKKQLPLTSVLLEAGANRFRPIMLTTLTTFIALGPLMLERSPQAAFLVPMAVALAFGVLAATMISLVLVPSLIMIGQDIRTAVARRSGLALADNSQGVEDAYQRGYAEAWRDRADNPFADDDVLGAAWEAGYIDGSGQGHL